jgi:3-oxoacyl-[acyl-carrier-protein] synthase III
MDELIGAGLAEEALPRTRRGAGITSVSASLPQRVVGNEEVAERAGVSADWIVERTGVEERRVAEPGERLTEYAADAGRTAIEAAGVDAAEVELVLVATMSHEYLTPNAAPLVAKAMGCSHAGAIDIGSACTGFVSALALAAAQIESGRCETAVVIGADLLTRFTDPTDRGTAALFGDGAGAVVVRAMGRVGIGPAVFGSDGARAELIETGREEALIRMKGPDTYRQAVDRLSEAAEQSAELAGVSLDEVDLFVFHQANGRILTAVGDRLGLPAERVINTIRWSGNTSAASIPIALAQADADGLLGDGSKVLLAAFGGGLTWGATLIEWGVGDAA